MGDLFDWALSIAQGKQTWHDSTPLLWNAEIERFFTTLKEFDDFRSEEHTSELQSHLNLVCRLLLEKKKKKLATTGAIPVVCRGLDQIDVKAPLYTHSFTVIRLLVVLFALRASLIEFFFFFNDTATTEIYTLSLHDALPISSLRANRRGTIPHLSCGTPKSNASLRH